MDTGAVFIDITQGGWVQEDGAQNPYRISPHDPNVIEIGMKHKGGWVLGIIDADRHAEISKDRWCAGKAKNTIYVTTSFKDNDTWKKRSLHRLLFPHFDKCDHVNGKAYDNRASNLREGNGNINEQNVRTKTMGIYTCEERHRHEARVRGIDRVYMRKHFKWTPDDEDEKWAQYVAASAWRDGVKDDVIDELIARQLNATTTKRQKIRG